MGAPLFLHLIVRASLILFSRARELDVLGPLLWRFEHVLLLVGGLEVQLSELQEAGDLALLVVPPQVVVVEAVAVEDAPLGHWRHALGPTLDASRRSCAGLFSLPRPASCPWRP
eukprot:5723784-Pyramimonas_sp.AAC.1